MKRLLKLSSLVFAICLFAACGGRSGYDLPQPVTRNDALLVLRASLIALGSANDDGGTCPEGGAVSREDIEESTEYTFTVCRVDDLTLTGALSVSPYGTEYAISLVGETPDIDGLISTDAETNLLAFDLRGQGLETSEQITLTGTGTINEDGTLDGSLTLSFEGEQVAQCLLDDFDLVNSSCGDAAVVCGLDPGDFC